MEVFDNLGLDSSPSGVLQITRWKPSIKQEASEEGHTSIVEQRPMFAMNAQAVPNSISNLDGRGKAAL